MDLRLGDCCDDFNSFLNYISFWFRVSRSTKIAYG